MPLSTPSLLVLSLAAGVTAGLVSNDVLNRLSGDTAQEAPLQDAGIVAVSRCEITSTPAGVEARSCRAVPEVCRLVDLADPSAGVECWIGRPPPRHPE